MLKHYIIIIVLIYSIFNTSSFGQGGRIWGQLKTSDGSPLEEGWVFNRTLMKAVKSDSLGNYLSPIWPPGTYVIYAFSTGFQSPEVKLQIDSGKVMHDFILKPVVSELDALLIQARRTETLGLKRLESIEGTAIYEGKKSEVIDLNQLVANTANNNARQIYGKITGLNIWESDASGLQLGIGGRGLSPNRTANFNTRQNGYDISADALGYPESYYTPPPEALERIEIVRGAASLQYGTQFGGLLNFVFKKGSTDYGMQWTSRASAGSYGFKHTFQSLGGTSKNGKLQYYTFYQYKEGNGWRPNGEFSVNTGYASVAWQALRSFRVTAEYTHLDYLAHQPGGLTDTYFNDNPQQSVRSRNWFNVNWNLYALHSDLSLGFRTRMNIRVFGLQAQRLSLGNLERINVADLGGNRTLIDGRFKNIGAEGRLLHIFGWFGRQHPGVIGGRVYHGRTQSIQGTANNQSGPSFQLLTPENPDNSDYTFPNYNYSLFAEQVVQLLPKISITPGVRWEYIQTSAKGYYHQQIRDLAGNIITDTKIADQTSRARSFMLAGLGLSYKITSQLELYSNLSQNYRAINFTDLRINNPNLIVDSLLKDESGYTFDLGVRGGKTGAWMYEITGFYIRYKDRIGQILKADRPPLYLDYRFRTNIANAENTGVEAFGEYNILQGMNPLSLASLSVFVNAAYIHSVYVQSKDPSIEGNSVEMVPPWVFRTGITWKRKGVKAAIQYSFTDKHFSDASNAIRTSSAVEGLIPAYSILDASLSTNWRNWTLEANLNNMLNRIYFTRRAESYPGPGIIPAEARNLTLTLQYKGGIFPTKK